MALLAAFDIRRDGRRPAGVVRRRAMRPEVIEEVAPWRLWRLIG
jgi:hypothetical protein